MREHGIVLSGPDPRDLIDPVTATDLRREVIARIDAFMPDLLTWSGGLDNAWTQPYVVGSLCRMLHTLEVGRVTSKQEALRWAKATLDVEWSDLIQGALDDRPEPWVRVHQPARLGTVDRTWAFIEYTQALADGQWGRFKRVLAS
jgi:hypothetical protein